MCNPAIERIGVDRDRVWCVSAGPCGCFLGWSAIGEHERLLRLGDLGHGRLGEEAPSLELPFLLLLQQLTAYQPGDGGVVGEDADDVGASFDEGVGRAHLSVRR